MYVTPGITSASLASTGKYADANYGTVFLKDSVEVFDLENTKIFVSKEAVLCGLRCKDGLYRIPLRAADAKELDPLPELQDIPDKEYNERTKLVNIPSLPKPAEIVEDIPDEDLNEKTMLVTVPPPKPAEIVQNVYELRTQREMVLYYHEAAGFPMKATWIKAIGNNQYSSWPGLTVEAVERHFPESLET